MRHQRLVLAAFAVLLPFGCAQAQPLIQSQEGIALQNEILQLQQQVQQLQVGGGGSGGSALGGAAEPPPGGGAQPANGSVVAGLLNQVQDLQSEVQRLHGEVDTLQNQVTTQHDATQKELGDLKFQMSNGAGGQSAPAAANAPAAAPPEHPASHTADASPLPASGSAHDLLHDADVAYARHDYARAEADARAVVAKHASSPEAYHAQYMLARALAAQGNNQDAAIAFDDAYNKNRTGPDAAQSLLGLAGSLADIKQREAACDTLSSLNSQFPNPSAAMQSRIDAVSHRAHCS
jgi:TolA-binding protein